MVLISFEGGDRCGKSTQITLLYKRLTERHATATAAGDENVILLKHPDRSTPSGKIIDQFLKGEIDLCKESITLCLTSNLWDTFTKIQKHLQDGKIVLIDRYIHTNYAYSQLRGIEMRELSALMEGIQLPHCVIYLRPDNSGDISNRTDFGKERYETIELQNKVRENFDRLLKLDPLLPSVFSCLILNSNGKIDEIADEIWNKLESLKII